MMILEWFNRYVLGAAVPLCLLIAGTYFTVRLRGVWLHPVKLWHRMMKPRARGGVSPGKALSLALAGTLGVGNLVGVAAAISMGGAGAVFWMWISAALAMMLKYAEIVLALRHRRRTQAGYCGGAMFYMEDSTPRCSRAGRVIAGIFAALCLIDAFSMGCVIQVNAVASAWNGRLSVPLWVIGGGIAVLVLWVGKGGSRGVMNATERLVPLMTVGFCMISLLAIGKNAARLPEILQWIVTDAFRQEDATRSLLGGMSGFLLSRGLRFGTMRGLLSNEAGCGTSPMAHADADTDDIVAQGGMGIAEVFVDTHVLCTMTALVILLAWDGSATPESVPMLLTISSYERLLGQGAGIFLCIAVLFFGLATVLCWSHYARRSCTYLCGTRNIRWMDTACLLVYCLFAVVGAFAAPEAMWQVSDFAIGSMTVLNIAVLWKCREEIVQLK